MTLRRGAIILFILAIEFSAQAQWAVQSAAMAPTPIAFSFQDSTATLSIGVRSLAGNTPFFVTITGGTPEYLRPRRAYHTTQPANYLEFDIYDNLTNRNPILPVTDPAITASNVISGVTAGNRRATVTCPVLVPEIQSWNLFPSGTYRKVLAVNLYQGPFVQGGPYTYRATRNVTVNITVANTYVGVQITNPGGTYGSGMSAATLDFGTLSTGQFAARDAVVKSYLAYTLTFSSLNLGSLRPVSGATPNIPYAFTFEGTPRSLFTPWTSGVYALLNPATGAERNHPLTFTIGTVNPMLQSAGLYTDTLTVTITTQ